MGVGVSCLALRHHSSREAASSSGGWQVMRRRASTSCQTYREKKIGEDEMMHGLWHLVSKEAAGMVL
jgi:hypothetical protein